MSSISVKWGAVLIALNTLFSTAAYADAGIAGQTTGFTDLKQLDPSKISAILEAANKGYLSGDPNGQFRPKATITRQELAVILSKVLSLGSGSATPSLYSDVSASNWSASAIEAVKQAGIMTGDGNGRFNPYQPVTKEELATIMVRAIDGSGARSTLADPAENSTGISSWAKASLNTAAQLKLSELFEDRSNPKAAVQRQDIATLLLNTFNQTEQSAVITSINGDFVTIGDTSYLIEGQLKELIGDTNREALEGAVLKFNSLNRHLDGLQALEIVKKGVQLHTAALPSGTLLGISANDVTIAGNVAGELKLNEGVSAINLQGNIGQFIVNSSAPVVINGSGSLQYFKVLEGAKITIDPALSIQVLQLPDSVLPSQIIQNYAAVQSNIKQIQNASGNFVSYTPAPSVSTGNQQAANQAPVVNTAPKVVAPVADRILTLGTSEVIDIAGVFKDDEQSQLKLTAVSGSSTVVKAVLTGTQLTLTPLKAGSNITILMSADDQNGKKTNSSFKISVNTPPAATSAVADHLVVLGAAAREIDLSSWFSDADSDSLIYEAVSSDPVIATAQISGHTLTVTGQTAGAAKVQLIAKDGRGGTAESEITVTVNKNPAAGNMEDQLLPVNGTPVEFPLDPFFSDDDLDPLTFTAFSSDPASVGAAVYGDKLILTPLAHGHSTVTVSVEDGRGGSSQVTFTVNVNTIPQVSAIPDRSMKGTDEPYTILLSDYFSDADSDNLTFSVQSGSPAVAAAEVAGDILKLNPASHGVTTISVVANDGYAGIVSASFELTVNDTPETGTTPLGDQMLQENGDTLTVDLSTAFADPEGDNLTYTVTSSDSGRAAVSITGHTLSVTPKSHGTATVTVMAQDSFGAAAQQSFTAVINAKPVAAAIAAQSLPHYGLPQELELSSYFNDPDGDVLVYSVTSADAATAEAAVTGSKLTLTPKSPGTTKITVQAHDGKGGITVYTFDVTVLRNLAPGFAGVNKQILQENGSTVDLELSAIFSDPEQDAITYSVKSEDTSIVATLLTGTKLTLTPKASGLVKVQVKASDDKGNDTTQDIEALVNAAPLAAAGSLPDLDLQENGSTLEIDLLPVFTDPEGDTLTYTAESDDSAKAAVSVTGSKLMISPKAYGSPVIQVTASDADGGKTKVSFTVHVNAAPKAVDGKLTDTTLYTGSPATEIDLSTAFTDADGDTLSFSASTDAGSTVNAAVTGKMLKLAPAAEGTAVITVTAQDQRGGQVTVSFTVTVSSKPNTAPEAVSAISPQILTPGVTNTRTYDLSQLFEDADNDTLTYTADIDSPAAGAVSVSGNMLSLSPAPGTSASGIVTVTASDGKGGTAAYSFALTTAQLVSNGLVPINSKQGVQSLSYDISKLFPGQTSFKVYMGTADSTFTGPTPLNGTIWTGTPMPGYVWIVGADGRAIVLSITVSPQGSGELFFSEYLDGGDGRIAVELYYKNTGTPVANPEGYTIEVYRYMKNTQTITSTSQSINTQWPTMSPYLFINDIFYDAFDIMNIWYYNDELSLYNPSSYDVVAIVLKKNGQIVDMLGNPASTQKFLSSGGTIVRKSGIYTGSGQFSLGGEWDVYAKGAYQFFGRHSL